MKLIRTGTPGNETPAFIASDGSFRDVSTFTRDFDHAFLADGGPHKLAAWLGANSGSLDLPAIPPDTRLGTPITRPGKIVCVGLNFADHAAEAGLDLPPEPVLFFKATSAVTGPDDGLTIPRHSSKTDWEVELAVVIGKTATYVDEADATDHIAGYCLHNDYSEREFQMERAGQWVKGKSCDTFAPLGPLLATPDEIADPHNLHMWLKVNGETKQDSNSSNLHFKIPFLISYISQFMTLEPGDVVSTGTPPGVGAGFEPPQFLKPGDTVELGIEGLGQQRQTATAAA